MKEITSKMRVKLFLTVFGLIVLTNVGISIKRKVYFHANLTISETDIATYSTTTKQCKYSQISHKDVNNEKKFYFF